MNLRKLLVGIACLIGLQQSASYAQEKDLSIIVIPEKSSMLSESILYRQSQLALKKVEDLESTTLELVYRDLPDRSFGGTLGRMMTSETQKACREIEQSYQIDIRFLDASASISYWDFGDGKPPKLVPISQHAGSLSTTYVYSTPGIYDIEIKFFDTSTRPILDPEKRIKVIVEACVPPAAPQLSVNPNIHKIVVE